MQPYSMYTCYAMYPQVRCNSILHSRKRLAKVSIFTPIFRLFPLIPIFIHVQKVVILWAFPVPTPILISTTNLRKIYFHRSALLERVLSPDSPMLLLPPQREGGDCTSPSISYSPHIRVFLLLLYSLIPFVIKQLYKQNTRSQRMFFSFITCTMLISLFRVSKMSEYLSIS